MFGQQTGKSSSASGSLPYNIFSNAAQTPSFNFATALADVTTVNNLTKDKIGTLADDVLAFCKCEYCSCYVSVGPIRMIDNKVACGRCKRESNGVRLQVVEALAKQFNFPCRYKEIGCNALLKWVLIDAHEKLCDFKEVQCTIVDCEWVGAKSTLKSHFEQKHACEIINAEKGVTMNLQEKKTSNFLYVSKSKAFMVLLSNDGEKIRHQVKFFCTSLEACMYIYNICVYDSEKKLVFLNQKLQNFDDELIMCNAGISVAVLQTVFMNSNNINISFQIKHTGSEITNLLTQNIECPVCLEPMFGLIYIGQCGHSLCEKCKRSLQNCPCCRGDFCPGIQRNKNNQEIRNYSLECLIKKLGLDV